MEVNSVVRVYNNVQVLPVETKRHKNCFLYSLTIKVLWIYAPPCVKFKQLRKGVYNAIWK